MEASFGGFYESQPVIQNAENLAPAALQKIRLSTPKKKNTVIFC